MKKSFCALISLLVLISCTSQPTQKKDEKSAEIAVMTVDQLQERGKDLVGKEVMVKGTVTHVCKEAGARCFIMGSTEDVSLRIEAGTIGSFSPEQMGSDIQVRGVVREVQLDEADLAEMEKSAAAGESANKNHALGHDGPALHSVDGGKHDSTTQAKKLEDMSHKLSESKEGYVPVYYLDGIALVKENQ
jgi:hypothetical protein